MDTNISDRSLARARELAAADLESAIGAVREALTQYARATHQLEERVGVELARKVDGVIIRHLVQAGLGDFLERKLTGTPASLGPFVAEQHSRLIKPT